MDMSLSVKQKQHLGRYAARRFLAITDEWQLTDHQRRTLAGAATRTTISTWRQRVYGQGNLQLGDDTYERIICIQEIHQALLEQTRDTADFLRKPQSLLGNISLLELMLHGQVIDLYQAKFFILHGSQNIAQNVLRTRYESPDLEIA